MNKLITYLKQEAEAISIAADRLDDNEIRKALNLIKNCSNKKNKIIVSGVGKSGIVGRKIAATFSSIGLMATYLNPLDALHGDIGIVGQNDVCLLLSNSGETSELINILPHLKKRSVPCIALVGNINSTLAKQSEAVLEAKVDKEVCPLNLAPTASTAVAMAIGDALATAWMVDEGISPEQFAINHPAGQLGKKLTLSITDIMIPVNKISTLYEDTPMLEIITQITKGGIGSACVISKTNSKKIIGIITDGDLRRSLISRKEKNWLDIKAKDIMTKNPITTKQDTLAIKALELMEKNVRKPITILPVTNDCDEIVGLIRLHDLIQRGLS